MNESFETKCRWIDLYPRLTGRSSKPTKSAQHFGLGKDKKNDCAPDGVRTRVTDRSFEAAPDHAVIITKDNTISVFVVTEKTPNASLAVALIWPSRLTGCWKPIINLFSFFFCLLFIFSVCQAHHCGTLSIYHHSLSGFCADERVHPRHSSFLLLRKGFTFLSLESITSILFSVSTPSVSFLVRFPTLTGWGFLLATDRRPTTVIIT